MNTLLVVLRNWILPGEWSKAEYLIRQDADEVLGHRHDQCTSRVDQTDDSGRQKVCTHARRIDVLWTS